MPRVARPHALEMDAGDALKPCQLFFFAHQVTGPTQPRVIAQRGGEVGHSVHGLTGRRALSLLPKIP